MSYRTSSYRSPFSFGSLRHSTYSVTQYERRSVSASSTAYTPRESMVPLRTFYAFGARSQASAHRSPSVSSAVRRSSTVIRSPSSYFPTTPLPPVSIETYQKPSPWRQALPEEPSSLSPRPAVTDQSQIDRLNNTVRTLQNDKASLEHKCLSLQRQLETQTNALQASKATTERKSDREKELELEVSRLRKLLQERELNEKSLLSKLHDAQNDAKKWKAKFEEQEAKLLRKGEIPRAHGDPEIAGLSYLKQKLVSDMAELQSEMRDAIDQLDK